jgi:beta-galactosidase/beta-glucuronidase
MSMIKQDFNNEWSFYRNDEEKQAIKVNLPHDAMIHEQRRADSEGKGAVGFFPGGVYVYEKAFDVPQEWQNKCVTFEFEGIYKNSKVFINGVEAGGRAYGYTDFFVEADSFLKYGKKNTIRVVADNSKLPNSRWYSGSGIYRPVKSIIGNKTHIDIDGVKIKTLSINPTSINVETKHNGGDVEVEILSGGKSVAKAKGDNVTINVSNAKLWSEKTPELYECRVTLTENNAIVDEVTEKFGIRTLSYNAKEGFRVNGIETKLRGSCIHHDNGILGACAYDKAEQRRVRIMKQAGFNAIRSAHNPMSKAMLDACDQYGMYVMDETFDMWYIPKNKYDYTKDFEQWHESDMASMVAKDYNHPCVVMYSIGNEVSETAQPKGIELTKEMTAFLHSLDNTRPVTAGINLALDLLLRIGLGLYKEKKEKPKEEKKQRRAKPQKEKLSGSAFYNAMVGIIGKMMNNLGNSNICNKVTSPALDALEPLVI